jgi:hypothetical protein
VAVANGLARADIGAAWKGDAGALASAEGQQAREKGGCEREVAFGTIVPFLCSSGGCPLWADGLVRFWRGREGLGL